jgi:hypothetical protein
MRGFVTIFFNRKKNAYVVQPAAKGPVSTTDFGEPVQIPADQFDETALDAVMEGLLSYQRQVFDRAKARQFTPKEYRVFLKDHLAVSARWEDAGKMTIRPLHPEGGGLVARDGEETVLEEREISQKLIGAILGAFGKAG